jgi:hypothetical protein
VDGLIELKQQYNLDRLVRSEMRLLQAKYTQIVWNQIDSKSRTIGGELTPEVIGKVRKQDGRKTSGEEHGKVQYLDRGLEITTTTVKEG